MSIGAAVRAALVRLREAAGDASYAQRRLFERQTGCVVTPETRRRQASAQIAALDALFDADPISCMIDERELPDRDTLLDAPYEDRRDYRPRVPGPGGPGPDGRGRP